MSVFLKKIIISILVICFCQSSLFAQTSEEEYEPGSNGPRKKLTVIVFSGLTGAIIGLSTLSFYGRPQDKLSNIAIGFALGVITGTIYTTYKTATEPYELSKAKYLNEVYGGEQFKNYFAQSKETLYPVQLNYNF